jgi:glycine cleavage system H protein
LGEVKYTPTHEWIEVDGSEGVIGITERKQLECGEIVYVELPAVGDEYEEEEAIGRLETADGSSYPVYAPVTGEILEVNTALEDGPDLINQSPEGDGWICRISIESPRELDALMDAGAYDEYEEEEPDDEFLDEEDFYDDEEDY